MRPAAFLRSRQQQRGLRVFGIVFEKRLENRGGGLIVAVLPQSVPYVELVSRIARVAFQRLAEILNRLRRVHPRFRRSQIVVDLAQWNDARYRLIGCPRSGEVAR